MRDPTETPPKSDDPEARRKSDRLAEALRANLARRKVQKRAREAAGQGDTDKE